MRLLLFMLFSGFLACTSSRTMQSNPSNIRHPFDLQGHRGCRGLMPENTIPAMIKALELGVNTLEMDVVITADKQVILSHEPFFNHEITTTANGSSVDEKEEQSLNIYAMTWEQTRAYDVGLKPHPRFPEQQKLAVTKPLLREVFTAVKDWCGKHARPIPHFNIETKCMPHTDGKFHPAPAEFVDLLMAVVEEEDMTAYTIIQSFDFRSLQHLRKTCPSIPVAMLIEPDDTLPFAQQLGKLGFIPEIYSPAHELVTPLLVKQCNEMGIRLIPWTVNDVNRGLALRAMGVHGIITDYPNRVR